MKKTTLAILTATALGTTSLHADFDSGAIVAAVNALQGQVAVDDMKTFGILTDQYNTQSNILSTANQISSTATNIYNNAVQQLNEEQYHTRIMGDPKNIGQVLDATKINTTFQTNADGTMTEYQTGTVFDSSNQDRQTLYGSADPIQNSQDEQTVDPLAKYRDLDSRVDIYNTIEASSRKELATDQKELSRLMGLLANAQNGNIDQSKIFAIQAEMLSLQIKMMADQAKLTAAMRDTENRNMENLNDQSRTQANYETARKNIISSTDAQQNANTSNNMSESDAILTAIQNQDN